MIKWKAIRKFISVALELNYSVCIIVGMVGIILYMAGMEKCKHTASISLIIYLLINLIGKCMLRWWIYQKEMLNQWNLVIVYLYKRMNTQ